MSEREPDWDTVMEMRAEDETERKRESEASGWYCPECGKVTAHTTCDGCKFLICYVCGYPCACNGWDGEELF